MRRRRGPSMRRGALRSYFCCLAVSLSVLDVRPLGAQASAPAEATVEAPRLLSDPGVSYPVAALRAGYSEIVEVVLVLRLDATGEVVEARPEPAADPRFDEAALEAARRIRFSPARRGGVPTPAVIRFKYRFEPPPP